MRTALLGSIAALLLGTGLASAADLQIPADPYVPTASDVSWSGFYAGVNLGYGTAKALHNGSTTGDDSELDGWIVGGQIGYNADLDGIVLGIEGDVALATINEGDDFDHFDEDDGIHGIATLRGRVGASLGSFLLYGTAGLAVAQLDTSDEAQTITGWVAGIGAEAMVTDTISLKAEYLHHDFGTVDVEGFGGDFDITAETFKVGLNFHF